MYLYDKYETTDVVSKDHHIIFSVYTLPKSHLLLKRSDMLTFTKSSFWSHKVFNVDLT